MREAFDKMIMRIVITAFLILSSAGCACLDPYASQEERSNWVPLEPPPYEWPDVGVRGFVVPEGRILVWRRYKWASRGTLGTTHDLYWIKKVVLAHMQMKNGWVNDILWLTRDVVMVGCGWPLGRKASAKYRYVLEREQNKWQVVAFYNNTYLGPKSVEQPDGDAIQ